MYVFKCIYIHFDMNIKIMSDIIIIYVHGYNTCSPSGTSAVTTKL